MKKRKPKVPTSTWMWNKETVDLLKEQSTIEGRSQSKITEDAFLEYIKKRRSQTIEIQ